jgi:hypothetical protein
MDCDATSPKIAHSKTQRGREEARKEERNEGTPKP